MRGTNRAEQVDRGGQNVVVVEQAVHAPRPGGALASDGQAPSPSEYSTVPGFFPERVSLLQEHRRLVPAKDSEAKTRFRR